MNGIDNTVHVDTSNYCKSRPFRHYRSGFSIPGFLKIDKFSQVVSRVANSILGKAATFGVAEVVGATVGQMVCEPIGEYLGGNLIPIGRMAAGVFFLDAMDSKKTFYEKGIRLSILVGLQVLSGFSSSHMALALVGGIVGKGVGAILGGYSGLALVKSPTVFHDKNSPWDGYSWSMVRYCIAGLGCDAVGSLMDPNRMNFVLTGSGYGARVVVQTLSYNSNILFPHLKHCFQKKQTSARAQIPLYVKMVTNRYCGHSHQFFAKELSGFIEKILSLPNDVRMVFGLKILEEYCVIAPALKTLDKMADKAEKTTNILIRSLYHFIQVLWSSKGISWAHKKFEAALNDAAADDETCKETTQKLKEEVAKTKDLLIKEIESELSKQGSLLKQTFLNMLSDQLKGFQSQMFSDLVKQIKQAEQQLFGYSIMQEKHETYLNVMLQVYFPSFVMYTVLNADKFKGPLMPIEERDGLTALNNLLFSYYFNHIMPSIIVKPMRLCNALAIQGMYAIGRFFAQFEQSTYIPDEKGLEQFVKDNHVPFPATSEQAPHIIKEEDGYLMVLNAPAQ